MGKWVRLFETAFVVGVLVVAADLVMGTSPGAPSAPRALASALAVDASSPPALVIDRTRILFREAPTRATAQPAPRLAPRVASPASSPRKPAGADPLQGMTLQGTMDGGTTAAAFFTDSQGRQVVLRRGQVVGGWKVVAMGQASVKLQSGGRKRIVYVPSLQSPSSSPPAPPNGGVTTMAPPLVARSVTDSNYLVWSRPEARAFLVGADPAGDVRATTRLKDGTPLGCNVEWVRPSSPLARMGVQGRDLLLAANGRPIHGSEDLKWVYQALQKDSSLELALERDGRRAALHLEVR